MVFSTLLPPAVGLGELQKGKLKSLNHFFTPLCNLKHFILNLSIFLRFSTTLTDSRSRWSCCKVCRSCCDFDFKFRRAHWREATLWLFILFFLKRRLMLLWKHCRLSEHFVFPHRKMLKAVFSYLMEYITNSIYCAEKRWKTGFHIHWPFFSHVHICITRIIQLVTYECQYFP